MTSPQFVSCSKKELNLKTVLLNGQSFRWKNHDSFVIGVALNRIWKIWREDDSRIGFEVLGRFPRCETSEINDAQDLKNYFQLNVNLTDLYSQWKSMDSHFASIFESTSGEGYFEGIRILKQPLLETIFAFICSANNNITRISRMVNTLSFLYGDKTTIGSVKEGIPMEYYDFPSLEQFVENLDSMETTLRKKGFGYRAKYIAQTVKKLNSIENGFENFEKKLKSMDYSEAKMEIQKLDGIGPKVADCICLMALGHHHVVPVDTHVFQITANHYLSDLKKNKTVTDTVYKRIGSFYSEKFGSHAGWAHSVLFSTRLKRFNEDSDDVVKKKKK